ncbi:MAG: hypothetical protein FRX49_05890 [Trebouxia sp. A1-2]|nr:MAG: hypothetical protein FRX49_05890 [Trebouxia sp. A1-2]
MTELGADGIQDQMRNGTPASLQSSNSSLDTVVYDLNGRHTLEMDTLRKTVDVHAAELSAQVAQLQGEREDERRAQEQQGRSSRTWPYQRITAAEAASHEGKNKAQALQADLTGARQAAVDLKVHVDAALARLKLQLDAAVKENTMLD